MYAPTNGRLLRPDVIDRLGDAGVATFNLAVDAVDLKPGLPKALTPIRAHFDHLVMGIFRPGRAQIHLVECGILRKVHRTGDIFDENIVCGYHTLRAA